MDDFRAAVAANPKRAGLFLDFDGTLSHVVQIPSDARPVEGARETLAALGGRLACVAIVSGRSAHQLLEWLGPEVEIWGVHGAERTVDGRVELSDAVAPYEDLMISVREQMQQRAEDLKLEGVIVEDKAAVVGLHYRNSPAPEEARAALVDLAGEVAAEHGLELAEGRMVIELKPPVELSKSDVVLERARALELQAAAFLGDDTVDLPAFGALDELARAGATTARVAVRSEESPEELLERADQIVDGPEGALEWLRSLL